ncbi:LysR family transcriptional regulator [Afifella marina]|uniref:DNA-binding transcriptional regulator, LysR family n=1 Tax=Afifella marina DSM 2698 TaxID=1120955 RepID=A0A1G5MJC1_AFIMA|nr:LysR family transcriptional regulator [Afifella marina]MBK1625398.1 LysR family transcriptional regulator [Afifella marina DSM 2698]MBK1628987.1 LysR family transcriptional regulator [Afifella marina]MBK5916941.1 hypothetical protein [Afifella marina]RAI22767.1 hypothetical protein CH311_03660 [Afifella marina DSM 2698]SCZ24480.1 DNA-binding transcriptional regulator, LysR family [Afifella marina DSM 2698]
MEFHHLRSLVGVAETGSISRAAEHLATSQPAVSAHIKQLEEELGFALFERSSQGMRLTAAGAEMLVRARAVLKAREAFLDHGRSIGGTLKGVISLGISPCACEHRLAGLIAGMALAHPLTRLDICEASSTDILERIRSGELLAGCVSTEPDLEAGLAAVEIDTIVVRAAIPSAWQERLAGADSQALSEIPWLLPPPGTQCRRLAEAILRERDIHPQAIAGTVPEKTARELIAGGMAGGFLHISACSAETPGISWLSDMEGRAAQRLVYADRKPQNALLTGLLDVARSALPQLSARPSQKLSMPL